MEQILSTTLKHIEDIKTVFLEVPYDENLPLPSASALHLYHLNLRNKRFNTKPLRQWLYRNIGKYVFSRSEIQRYIDKDDRELIVADALKQLRDAHGIDLDNLEGELGNMLIYALLEGMMNAPKIVSRVELANDLDRYHSETDGIHLLFSPEDVCSQLIFASSKIFDDLQDAIDQAFEAIRRMDDHVDTELDLVERETFSRIVDPAEAAALKKALLPSPDTGVSASTSYGIFLGYTLGLDRRRHPKEDYAGLVHRKMAFDLHHHADYIAKKILANGLDAHAFYIYTLPFDSATSDARQIMNDILN